MNSASERGVALVGTSGWAYREWRGNFYPKGLVQAKELGYLAEHVATIEMNSPFYRLQTPGMYEKWLTQVPGGFKFAVKGWRGVTHFKKLRDADQAVAKFFDSGPLTLGASLGPILWQLPPSLKFAPEVLGDFLDRLPKTHGEAADLVRDNALSEADPSAAESDKEGALFDVPVSEGFDPSLPLSYAIEPRNDSFASADVYALLREHDVALVRADSAGRHPRFEEVTADFTYVRLHGSPRIYYSNYTEEDLETWAEALRPELAAGHDCYVYFDNTAAGHAPVNACRLQELLST